jgi:Zn-dependent peptidase ImmA (M78 family)/DNA-binding XRE family transcriptional regulator
MIEALITPKMLEWAIDRVDENYVELARKLNVKPEKINDWEKGYAFPTFRQAQELAKKLKIPFGYLYLDTPQKEDLPLPDLRTVRSTASLRPSVDFMDVLYDSLRKQQWYREYTQQEDASPLPFIGKFSLNDDIDTIAADIRATLDINDDLRQKCSTWEEFLTELVRRAEQSRILILRSGIVGSNTHRKLSVEEFRGFVISDELAPLVFINANDYKTAQIFTLIHELAHLWIGQSGISNPDYKLRSREQRHRIDQLCDGIAAETLVPREDFYLRWNDFYRLDDNLNSLARKYRVSQFVVLRRAYELGKMQRALFLQKYHELLGKTTRKKGDGGGDFRKLLLARNSTTFTNALLVAMSEARVLPTDAAALLNVKVSTLRTIENLLFWAG